MSKIPPYSIQHIRLNEPLVDIRFASLQSTGFYCIFWWKEIPLGQIFIEPKSMMNMQAFEQEMEKAVQPTFDFYFRQSGLQRNDDVPRVSDRAAFAEVMDDVAGRYISSSLPDVVDVSVVICTRNRSMSLRRCLNVLLDQKSKPREIIVIDNAPEDDSTFLVVQQFGDLVQYFQEPRAGLDIARNTGALKATGSVVAYVDDDVLVHQMWAYHTWQTFSDPKVAAVTGLVIAAELDTESQQIFEKYWSFNRGYIDQVYDQAFFTGSLEIGPPVWEIGAGANMAFRKSTFNDVGYFDERLDVGAAGCSGDSELWYRILAKGFTIQYNPRAVVYHEHRRDLEALHKQLFNYMRGHAASALIQQSQNENAGYRKRIFSELPKYYKHLIKEGFPSYKLRYRTVFSEMRGLVSGILFYHKHKATPPKNLPE